MSEQVFQLFVSSPGDVLDERRRVEVVVDRLNREFEGAVRFKVIRWEGTVKLTKIQLWLAQYAEKEQHLSHNLLRLVLWISH
jgi:hypothetical protein